MMDKFQLLHIVAGIGWEPEIRGALTVLVGSLVLFGLCMVNSQHQPR